MKKTAFIALLCSVFLLGALSLSCKKIPQGPDGPDNPSGPVTPDNPDNPDNPGADYFKLVSIYDSSKEADTFHIVGYEAGSDTYLVQTNLKAEQISAVSDADWCVPVYDGDRLKVEYSQYGEKNQILQPRSCTVEVTAGTVYHKTLTLVQQSHHFKLGTFTYRNQFQLPANGEPLVIYIDTSLWDWQIENPTDWIEAEHVDRNTLRVAAKPKAGGSQDKRNGIVYLYSVTEKVFDTYTEGAAYKLYFYDEDPTISGEEFGYGDHTDWD